MKKINIMRVIINADDFGLTKSINEAVFILANSGSLSSTTVMVNMPYWKEINALLSKLDFGIGLHFNITEGKPICHPSSIPSIVKDNGMFYNFSEFRKKSKQNRISKRDILIELKAQYDLLYSQVGSRLTHIDSHQAIHKYKPVSNAIYEFSNSFKSLGLRSPKHYFIGKSNKIVRPSILRPDQFGLKRILVEIYYDRYQSKLSKKYKMPDGELLDVSLQKTITFEKLKKLIPNNFITIEIPCHPATTTNDLPPSKLTDKRVREFEILKSQAFKEALKKYELINFSNL